jgi:dTDP-4-dehydrorhamnose reductase
MKKVLIFGAGGLLGQELAQFDHDSFEMIGVDHIQCDVINSDEVKKIIEEEKPDVIINCAVIVSVDKCENEPELAEAVNVGGLQNILEAVRVLESAPAVVQISSSEVFGRVNEGEYKVEGYSEDDEPKPVSMYQKTKTEAEKVLQDFVGQNPKALSHWYIARAGWLYGRGRPTFVEQFTAKLQEEGTLEVILDQWRSPTWTRDFAQGLFNMISAGRESGIYHITNEVERGEASTLDVVEELVRSLGTDKVKASLKLVSRGDIFKIPRAPSNVILNTRLPKLPYWREALREYLMELGF